MKKITVVMSLALLSLTLMSQQNPVDRVFQKYAMTEGVTSVQISRGMMDMLAGIDAEDETLKTLASSITSINILHAPEIDGKTGEIDFYSEIMQDLPVQNYNELMRVNSQDQNVLFLVDEINGVASELLMIVGGGKENVLISIKGNLDMKQLSSLASVGMPGMNHLHNLEK